MSTPFIPGNYNNEKLSKLLRNSNNNPPLPPKDDFVGPPFPPLKDQPVKRPYDQPSLDKLLKDFNKKDSLPNNSEIPSLQSLMQKLDMPS
ncbi:MAG: hypothetical protein K2X66_04570 [Cyanobacteria bacterium]|nr:hypothetical protein [Cyanobacteriota bacterium]